MPFEVTILGSNSAIPTSDRYPTAQVLHVLGRFFLIDCGEGTQIQIRRNNIGFGKIKHIFISHLHGDHYYGLIGLLSTFNLLGRKTDVHIYSASELKNLIQPQIDFIKGEMQYKIFFHPLNFKKTDLIFSDKKVEVFSFPLKHSTPTCGFLFREIKKQPNIIKEKIQQYQIPISEIKKIKAGADFITSYGKTIHNEELTIAPPPQRSYAFCTDTAFYPEIADTIKGVNLLYHETTFTEEMVDFAHKTLHSTAKEAAKIASMANVKKLIIGHFSARFKDVSIFEKEARTIFNNCESAIDGTTYKIL